MSRPYEYRDRRASLLIAARSVLLISYENGKDYDDDRVNRIDIQ